MKNGYLIFGIIELSVSGHIKPISKAYANFYAAIKSFYWCVGFGQFYLGSLNWILNIFAIYLFSDPNEIINIRWRCRKTATKIWRHLKLIPRFDHVPETNGLSIMNANCAVVDGDNDSPELFLRKSDSRLRRSWIILLIFVEYSANSSVRWRLLLQFRNPFLCVT